MASRPIILDDIVRFSQRNHELKPLISLSNDFWDSSFYVMEPLWKSVQHSIGGMDKIRHIFKQSLRMSYSKSVKALPPKPAPPNDSDCCDSACELCVKDIYEQELKIWEHECRSILLNKAPKSLLSPEVYTRCRLVDITPVTDNTNMYTFDSKGYAEIKPGQHLILRDLIGGSNVTRQYTPISVPTADQFTFKIIIKSYKTGLLTSHIKRNWMIGNEYDWRGPHGLFLHQPNKYIKYVMLAAGTGIAPMLNIARSIVEDDSDMTAIKLLYSCQTYEDILLKSELKELTKHWNFTYKTFLSREADAEKKKLYGENIVGRKIELTDISDELINLKCTRILLCGTRQFDSAMLEYCKSLTMPSENIHKF